MVRISRSQLVAAMLFSIALSCGCSPANDTSRRSPSPVEPPSFPIVTRAGACDASAAVAVGRNAIVVGTDEVNVLDVYGPDDRTPRPGAFDASAFLGLPPKGVEADIEAATRIGDDIYWITSHGADKNGRPRQSGRRLFATHVEIVNDRVELTPIGAPYELLVEDFVADPELRAFDLEAAASRPPKGPNALNIEGLTATPSGGLLIGFRNPIPGGKALVVPLDNPRDVITGKGRAALGPPKLLPLQGLGIRSIEYSAARGEYLIVAGPAGIEGPFHLFRWTGSEGDAPQEVPGVSFAGLQPEALIVYPDDKNEIEVLSDDGTLPIHGVPCKDLPIDQQAFRSLKIRL